MELLQPKSWSRLKALLKVDFYVVRYPLLVLIILSIIACIYPEASRCSAKWEGNEPAVYTKCYRYIQFYPAILIAFMTGEIFEETFRPAPKEYIRTLGLSPVTLLLKRTIFWWSVFLTIEMLPIIVLFSKIKCKCRRSSSYNSAVYSHFSLCYCICFIYCYHTVSFSASKRKGYSNYTLYGLLCHGERFISYHFWLIFSFSGSV